MQTNRFVAKSIEQSWTKIVNTFWTITLLFSRAFILEKNLLFKVDFLFCSQYTLIEVTLMEEKITETYTKEEKSLTKLIQEWVNENTSILYCNYEEKNIKYQCR